MPAQSPIPNTLRPPSRAVHPSHLLLPRQELTAVVDTAVLQAPALGDSPGEQQQELTAELTLWAPRALSPAPP
jgi:hypothetical protein